MPTWSSFGFRGGASHAIAIREIIRGDDYRMRLDRNDDGVDPGDAALERGDRYRAWR